jgi:hypothetical protein
VHHFRQLLAQAEHFLERNVYVGQSRRFTAMLVLVFLTAIAAYAAKAAWNAKNDPPGVMRPCMFCSPYVPYKSPPLEPPR